MHDPHYTMPDRPCYIAYIALDKRYIALDYSNIPELACHDFCPRPFLQAEEIILTLTSERTFRLDEESRNQVRRLDSKYQRPY